jgi:hypothetical protein
MADVLLMEDHPHGCTVCMAVRGPFVVYKVAGLTIQTVEGPLQVDTEFAVCAHNDGREGCIGQGARADGYVAGDEHAQVVEQVAAITEAHAELEAKYGELEQQKTLDRKALAAELAEEIIARAG